MSMLAERKVKQRWSLNPRGKDWSEDSNKFGQKMLEKMGWSKGKGLGPKENGIVDHVKVSYKNDSKGMGYKDSNDQWTEHDTNFNALLQSLSGAAPPEKDMKLSSLEKKSQSSRVRVHYKKFTRGKDLSRCSQKDLANIFGKKSFNVAEAPIEEEKEEKEETKSDGFYGGGSMFDYFKKKLPNYGKSNGFVVGSNGVLKCESDEEEPRVGFGFGFEKKRKGEEMNGTPKKKKKEEEDEKGLSNPAFDPLFNNIVLKKHVLNTIEEETEETRLEEENEEITTKKKGGKTEEIEEETTVTVKKKKKKKNTFDNPNFDEKEDRDAPPNDTYEVKRKKKKDKIASILDNPSFDISDGCQNGSNPSYEVERKNKKDKIASALDNPSFDISDSCQNGTNDIYEVKRKKKNKSASALDNPSFDISDVSQNGFNASYEVKRKKKKDKCLAALDNPTFDVSDSRQDAPDTFEVKRKKKIVSDMTDSPHVKSNGFENLNFDNNFEVKRKKKYDPVAIDNPNFDMSNGHDSYVDSTFEVKRKKKDKSASALDNPSFDMSSGCQNGSNASYEVERKKKEKSSSALDNPTFEDSLEKNEISALDEPSFDLILNVSNTPVAPKPPKKSSSVKRRKSVRFSDVNEERIIPNNEDLANRNDLFDINSRVIASGLKDTLDLDEISKKLDGFQAEVENDINEAKVCRYVGEVGNPAGENEKVPEGTRLKFRFANFGRSPSYLSQKGTKAKSSYKHLIKGDIILGFNNTNLHEIVGYGVNKTK